MEAKFDQWSWTADTHLDRQKRTHKYLSLPHLRTGSLIVSSKLLVDDMQAQIVWPNIAFSILSSMGTLVLARVKKNETQVQSFTASGSFFFSLYFFFFVRLYKWVSFGVDHLKMQANSEAEKNTRKTFFMLMNTRALNWSVNFTIACLQSFCTNQLQHSERVNVTVAIETRGEQNWLALMSTNRVFKNALASGGDTSCFQQCNSSAAATAASTNNNGKNSTRKRERKLRSIQSFHQRHKPSDINLNVKLNKPAAVWVCVCV